MSPKNHVQCEAFNVLLSQKMLFQMNGLMINRAVSWEPYVVLGLNPSWLMQAKHPTHYHLSPVPLYFCDWPALFDHSTYFNEETRNFGAILSLVLTSPLITTQLILPPYHSWSCLFCSQSSTWPNQPFFPMWKIEITISSLLPYAFQLL